MEKFFSFQEVLEKKIWLDKRFIIIISFITYYFLYRLLYLMQTIMRSYIEVKVFGPNALEWNVLHIFVQMFDQTFLKVLVVL